MGGASRSGSSCSRRPKSATPAMRRANSRGVACGARRAYAAASSPKRASARRRSTTSGWAANSCWRRSPSRSISRWTYRSGRVLSIADGAGAVQLEEHADPLARLGRHLRRLGRRLERGDHVELAPARDLGAAGDVHRAQLDRRAGQRAHDRGGVGRIGQQAQPGEHVADLGPVEERGRRPPAGGARRAPRARRRPPRPHGRRKGPAPRPGPGERARPRSAARRRRPPPGPGRARWRSARTRPRPRRRPARTAPGTSAAAARRTLRGHAQALLERDHARLARREGAQRAPRSPVVPGRPRRSAASRPPARASVAAARSRSCASSRSTCSNRRGGMPGARATTRSASGRDRRRRERRPRPASARGRDRSPRTRARGRRRPRPASEPSASSRRPAREVLGPDQVRLQPVDPADESDQERAGAASEVMALERQLDRSRSSSIAKRSAGPSTGSSGSTPAPGRLQDQRRQLDRREHEQLVVAGLGQPLEPCPRARRRAPPRRSGAAIRSGRRPRSTSAAKRASIALVLPVPAAPSTSSGSRSQVTASR